MSERESSLLQAFVDGELDLKSQLELEQRLAAEPALRQQVDELRLLRQELRQHASYHAAPEAVRRRAASLRATTLADAAAAAPVDARVAPPADAPAAARAPVTGLGRWLAWRPLAAGVGLAAIAMLAVQLAWLAPSRDDALAEAVVASHVRATLGQRLVDVASSDQHTVKPYLSSKLDFSPTVGALRLEGSELLGGRVDYLDGRPVAVLVYRQGRHVVDAYGWPTRDADRPPRFGATRGYRTAAWSQGGMSHWVISDLNEAGFQAFVDAVRELR